MFNNYLLLFFPLAITLHNIEEALWLPQWSRHASKYHQPVGKTEFHFALIIITALAYLVTFFRVITPDVVFISWLFYGFLGVMIINTVFPHLIATIALKKYAPGLFTGLFLIIPINSILIYRAIVFGFITMMEVIIATAVVGILLILIIPLLFKAGRRLINY
ncbi:MAG: HXXEE domain-containing protein [Deltaproteobacteria bacterium HGW-Deltaproteobacteria-10]|nr:MAG: HXXEE domain-containing protein [Deltaproteobacteria bacterium HGW-Deltaproteobacteria-10]